jgi:phosphinothricin acetyltransferase
MTSDDLPAVAAILNALLETTTYEWSETPHTATERADWFVEHRAAGRPALVAEDAGEVVGCASYGDFRDSTRWPGYRPTVEHSIHVRQDHWGRGIGRVLVEALIDRARAEGRRVMVAGIDASNVDSIRFHERLGFFEVARMPELGEKFGRRLDLVLMQRMLDPPARVSCD